MPKSIVKTKEAPQAIGPYSQATKAGGFVFTSGQIGLDPATGELVSGGTEAEARRALKSLRAVLDEAGARPADVVKTTLFLKDLADFTLVNGIYAEMFGDGLPARSTVEVARLPKDARFEIEAVAYLGDDR